MRWQRCLLWHAAAPFPFAAAVTFTNPTGWVGTHAPLPTGTPGPLPGYMRDNVNNEFGTAPDAGLFDGPLLGPISPQDAQKIKFELPNGTLVAANLLQSVPGLLENVTASLSSALPDASTILPRQSSGGYWLGSLGSKGVMPLAESNFTFFRNVKDYGAVGDGSTDDTAAINRAASDGDVCGNNCGSTTVHGSVVFFPPGTYLISSPIIQYFHQQFIGDITSPPLLRSAFNFTGIAMIDSDPYIPGGDGAEWYINQNNFLRSVRNLDFDLSGQARTNVQNGQSYVPTGIHWQAGQGTSITNCAFNMSGPNAVGIFMENGSGGFMADLAFVGGNAGMVVGSQQFTFRNLYFTGCHQAVSLLWNWGMSFQNVYAESCNIGFNMTAHGGITGQGTGSVSIIDSHFNGVPQAITIPSSGDPPNLVLDNVRIEASADVVQAESGNVIFAGSSGDVYVTSWAMGGAYLDPSGDRHVLGGFVPNLPNKPAGLIGSDGRYFSQSAPSHMDASPIVATDHGVSNDMTGDQTSAINSLLAGNIGSVIFFPAGIYLVQGTVFIPKGSILIGSGFSQIMGTGSYFQDKTNPNVMVRVGNKGDTGTVEIQDFLFTVQGPTAGCILLEWNIAQDSQGSAAMWNSNFRVGGAAGTDLQVADCQNAAPGGKCDASTLMFHLTPGSSGYFENVWAWVADHDLDNPDNAKAIESQQGVPLNVDTDVNIYGGRGVLIESGGPTWFWASASEHSELYNYQILNGQNLFFSHMQTESPYYQPEASLDAFAYAPNSGGFTLDPTFSQCSASNCLSAWASRILNSSDVLIYSTGFYSFFNDHQLGCGDQQNCQEHLIETNHVGSLYYYNIFTYGASEIISPAGGPPPIFFNDSNQDGYTSEVAAYLALSDPDAMDEGSDLSGSGGSGTVFVDPTIWPEPQTSRTVECIPPCTFVLPPITLTTPTTITIPPWTTTLEVGWTTTETITTTDSSGPATVTTVFFTSIIETTVLTIPPVTTTEIPLWEITINGTNTSTIYPTSSILPPPITITDDPNPLSQSGVSHPPVTRTIYPPPWPWISTTSSTDSNLPSITYQSGKPSPTCHSGCGKPCQYDCHPCDPTVPCLTNCCTGDDFCTSGCPAGTGPGNDGSVPPNDPNSDDGDDDDDDDDDECSTVTASSCSVQCIAGSGSTSTCTTTCSTFEGCEATGTTLDATETPAYEWDGTIVDVTAVAQTNDPALAGAASTLESQLISLGYVVTTGAYLTSIQTPLLTTTTPTPTTTTTTTTSTTPTGPPTGTGNVCIGQDDTVTPGGGPGDPTEVTTNFAAYSEAEGPCGSDSVYIASPEENDDAVSPCDVTHFDKVFNICGTDFSIENTGPTQFGSPGCGYALNISNNLYYGMMLNNVADNNPCSKECSGDSNFEGILVFENVPMC